jgi:hypothetical protein
MDFIPDITQFNVIFMNIVIIIIFNN